MKLGDILKRCTLAVLFGSALMAVTVANADNVGALGLDYSNSVAEVLGNPILGSNGPVGMDLQTNWEDSSTDGSDHWEDGIGALKTVEGKGSVTTVPVRDASCDWLADTTNYPWAYPAPYNSAARLFDRNGVFRYHPFDLMAGGTESMPWTTGHTYDVYAFVPPSDWGYYYRYYATNEYRIVRANWSTNFINPGRRAIIPR